VRPITDAEELTGLLVAGDQAAVDAFARTHPDALPDLLRRHPALVHRAGTAQTVAAMVAAGFDVNARHGGSTALHEAAFNGDVPLITALLAAGADPSLLDHEHRSTALGWAQYGNQPAAVDVLTAVT
jgi:ankyrin repeat protein